MKNFMLMAFFIFSVSTWADCSSQLAESFQTLHGSQEELSHVDQFKAYLEVLYEKQVITLADLQRVQDVFQKTGQVESPLKRADIPNIERDIHYDNLQNYVQFFSPEEAKEIGSWFTQFIAGIEKVLQAKSQANAATKDFYRPIKFISFNANGSTSASKNYQKISNFIQSTFTKDKYIVNHNFEIMDAPVTQAQWIHLMKYNPSVFRLKVNQDTLHRVWVDGREVVMQEDEAVNGQSLWDAMLFANKMSKLHNLKPVYDLSEAKLQQFGNKFLAQMPKLFKINAPNGDIYQAEGYRLPTASEMRLILGESILKEDLEADEHSTNGQVFLQTMGGNPFYFVAGHEEFLSEYFAGIFAVDANSKIKYETAKKSMSSYYTFNDSTYGFTDNASWDRHFRLVRNIFKNKEEAKP